VTLNLSVNRRLRTNRARNQIPHRRPRRLCGCNLPRSKLLLHQRVIMRQLLQHASPPPITSAVPNVTQPKRRRIGHTRVRVVRSAAPSSIAICPVQNRRMHQCHQRRPHPRIPRRLPRLLIHRLVRRLDRRIQPSLRLSRPGIAWRRNQTSQKCIRRKIACNFARRSPSHAIADNISASLRCGCARILIPLADTAAVGQHSVNEMVSRH